MQVSWISPSHAPLTAITPFSAALAIRSARFCAISALLAVMLTVIVMVGEYQMHSEIDCCQRQNNGADDAFDTFSLSFTVKIVHTASRVRLLLLWYG